MVFLVVFTVMSSLFFCVGLFFVLTFCPWFCVLASVFSFVFLSICSSVSSFASLFRFLACSTLLSIFFLFLVSCVRLDGLCLGSLVLLSSSVLHLKEE